MNERAVAFVFPCVDGGESFWSAHWRKWSFMREHEFVGRNCSIGPFGDFLVI